MGFRLYNLIARFKPRLSLIDLQRVTEDLFEISIKNEPCSELYSALRRGNPAVDHQARWKDNFQRILERIASKPTRKSQAAECRKFILELEEKASIFWAIFRTGDKDIQEILMTDIFFPESIDQDISQNMRLGATQYFDCVVDAGAFAVLYTYQFNSTVKIDTFDTPYRLMCQTDAEILIKTMLTASRGSVVANAYQSAISQPLSQKLREIMGDFRENLCLLSPSSPDTRPFQDFLQTYSTQIDEFKKTSSINEGAV